MCHFYGIANVSSVHRRKGLKSLSASSISLYLVGANERRKDMIRERKRKIAKIELDIRNITNDDPRIQTWPTNQTVRRRVPLNSCQLISVRI